MALKATLGCKDVQAARSHILTEARMKSAEIKQKEDKIHQKYLLHTQNSQCTEIYTKKDMYKRKQTQKHY